MSSFDQSAQKAKLDAFRSRFNQQVKPTNKTSDRALFRAKLNDPQVVRIVPMPDGDIPIKELKFYYNTGVKEQVGDRQYNISILSPSSYGESDPIEMFTEMFTSEDSEEYAGLNPEVKGKILQQLRPSVKFFIPVIVRGFEAQGVKYWGVTEKMLGSLLDNIEKDGQLIYDPLKGRDLRVWIEDMGTYKQTKFELGQTSELAPDDSSRNSYINNQPDLIEQFSKKSFNELRQIIKEVLTPYTGEPQTAEEAIEKPVTDYASVHKAAPVATPEAPSAPIEEPVPSDDAFDDLPF